MALVTTAVTGQNPAEVRVGSMPGTPRQVGFSVLVSVPRLAANGYQPVHLNFVPTATSLAADRTIDVVISPRGNNATQLDLDFYCRCELPQNSTSESFVFYIPYYVPWAQFNVELFEDGRPIPKGRQTFSVDKLDTRYAEQKTSVGILYPARDPVVGNGGSPAERYPDIRTLATVLGDGPIDETPNVSPSTNKGLRLQASQVQSGWVQFRAIDSDLNELHPSWLGYSQLDVILVRAATLTEIAGREDRFKPLTDWIAAGGNLWIYDSEGFSFPDSKVVLQSVAAAQVADSGAIERALDLSNLNDTTPLQLEHWGQVTKGSQDWQWQQSGVDLKMREQVYKSLAKEKRPIAEILPAAKWSSRLRTTTFGLGTITAIDEAYPFPGSFQLWQTLRTLHSPQQIIWTDRNGIDVRRGDDHYWRWLIEAVGGPPVKSFFLLNTLFVIVIGPVGYLFFRKHGRLHLLLFFAPAVALLLTIGLFVYALTADGWETRLRARQLTWQDTAAGYHVSQNRQTYFSALGRSDGLLLPADSAVFPIRNSSIQNHYRPPSGRLAPRWVRGDEGQVRYGGQFLPARTQVQFLTLRPEQSEPWVRFESNVGTDASAAEPGGTMTVINQGPLLLKCVVAADAKGQLWEARNVAVGASVAMAHATSVSPGKLLDVAPLAIDVPVPILSNDGYSNHSTNAQISLLEERLNMWLGRLPNNHFIARTEVRSELLGIDQPRIDDSLHVIMGAF